MEQLLEIWREGRLVGIVTAEVDPLHPGVFGLPQDCGVRAGDQLLPWAESSLDSKE
ncbi:MAG: hypothetical protein HFG26_07310 [Provencibacterium sp.]|jgi:hypothetical protein|nr:hypothetical protein [Provencibacterium sp.]